MDIKWIAEIRYKDYDNKENFVSYRVNARNRTIAKQLIRELFRNEYGVFRETHLTLNTEALSYADRNEMERVRVKIFRELDDEFRGKNYKEFLKAFKDFNGYNIVLPDYSDASFCFKFLGLTVRAIFVFDTKECYLDTREIYYTTEFGNQIVARNNWSEFYYVYGGI